MRVRKFFLVVIELFLILSLYKLWDQLTRLPIGLYLLICIVFLFFLNTIFAKMELMSDLGRNFIYKICSRLTFTKDWFGILTMAFVVLGFFISRTLFQSAAIAYIVIIFGLALAAVLIRTDSSKTQENGLYIIGFLIGIGIGSKYASNWFIITIFIFGQLFLYFTNSPGETEKGLNN